MLLVEPRVQDKTMFTIRISITDVWARLEYDRNGVTYNAKPAGNYHPMRLEGKWSNRETALRYFLTLTEYVERMPSGRKGWTYQIIWEA